MAPAEMGDRYVLALHDLIRSEDGSDLAAEILRESAGGYDVNAAKESLGFKDRASGKGKSYKDLEEAIERCRKARKRQDELLDKERELGELRQQREEAQRAADQIEWLDKAIRCHEAKEAHATGEPKHWRRFRKGSRNSLVVRWKTLSGSRSCSKTPEKSWSRRSRRLRPRRSNWRILGYRKKVLRRASSANCG